MTASAYADFICEEAHRLDSRDYGGWLELLAPDFVYWVPLRHGQPDPESELNIIYDDRTRLEDRIDRLTSGLAYAQDPPSLTTRSLSNFRCVPADGGALVTSRFILIEVRAGRQQTFGGLYSHRIREVDGALTIAHKKVELVNAQEPFYNLTFIL